MRMSRRRLQMAMWTEGRRRSPRISALELNAGSNAQQFRLRNSTSHGTSFSTRARKKRKLTQLQYVSAHQDPKSSDEQDSEQLGHEDYDGDSDLPVVQDEDNQKCQNEASNPEQTAGMPSELWLPEKRILELILDTLQRRDTHEIFAEPVDPDKVEDYYDIIEEPMDFGTMRAKLHEGMYSNLAQFEHDVFLITENAMHFNSSGTVYFRQARAIDDLAKKVFHVLKTDPENFEFEFSKTRRRSARRPQVNSNPSFSSTYAKVATNARSSNDAASRTVNSSMSPSSYSTRRGNSRCSATRFQTKDHDLVFGARDGKTSSFSEVDRRLSYRSLTSASLDESNSIGFSSYIDFKTLLHVNQKDISYRESLMKFVNDLGPTAKLVAQRKLADASDCQTPHPQCLFHTHEHRNNETSSSAQGRPPVLNTATSSLLSENVPDHLQLHGHTTLARNSDHKMGICDTDKRGKSCTGEDMDDSDVEIIEVLPSQDKRSIPSVFAGKVSNSNGMNAIDVPRKNRTQRDQNAGKMLSFADFRCLNGSVPKLQKTGHESTFLKGKDKLDNRPQSLDATSDKSRLSNALDYRVNGNISILSSSWPPQTAGISSFCQTNNLVHNQSMNYSKHDDQSTAAKNRIHGIGSPAEVGEASKLTHLQQAPSQFIYDLSYLKSRLDQSRFSQQGSSGIREQSLIPHNGDHQLPLLNPQHTELPLRLLR
ncbi:uncharacterized protein LOC120012976 isoform X2 [Tripterygium wilfordii]|uniref:uncharacterized protein LOC120012976 isoform X2 n=1 Tax=Tripterygium wilfordii TaxID=458696 RepID=UPI0018F84DCF|nr:uncharacterized protein LOC120012976 isoform X2 [Tripterygium wilfordii]